MTGVPKNFTKVLEIKRRSTSMISNDNIYNHNPEHLISQCVTDCFYCIVVKEIKIFFNLLYFINIYQYVVSVHPT